MSTYFNEFDKFPAAWLRALYPGAEVDERSIADVGADELLGRERCHFFAGIGGWEYALELAGWPAGQPVWTGSCPCQPFSAAGKGLGTADPRHLWPELRRLIAICRPPVVFGEQVASKAGRLWLAGVRADMEALGYAFGAADLCAAGVGAPHIRQRLYWVGYANERGRAEGEAVSRQPAAFGRVSSAADCGLAYADYGRREQRHAGQRGVQVAGEDERLDHADEQGSPRHRRLESDVRTGAHDGHASTADSACGGGGLADSERERGCGGASGVRDAADAGAPGAPFGPERSNAWGGTYLECTDGKARRVEPGVCPLAHGVPGRVGQLRGYGNAIVPQVAAQFVRAFMEAVHA